MAKLWKHVLIFIRFVSKSKLKKTTKNHQKLGCNWIDQSGLNLNPEEEEQQQILYFFQLSKHNSGEKKGFLKVISNWLLLCLAYGVPFIFKLYNRLW